MSRQARVVALAVGLLAWLAFFGLGHTASGLEVEFVPRFTQSTPGELQFWLGHALLVVPGTLLIGLGIAPRLGPWLAWVFRRVEALAPRERAAGLVILFIVALTLASLSRALFLRDLPVTDDESSVLFGGQVLALGRLTIPVPEPFSAFPKHMLYAHQGRLACFDWPGAQLVAALGELSGLGSLWFSAAAALATVAVAAVCARRLGAGFGLVGAVLMLLSPMAFALSATTHAHLLSRALLGVALWLTLRAQARPSLGAWASVGLALGAALLCRPVETVALSTPLLAGELLVAARERRWRRPLGGLGLGALGPIALFAAHNAWLTGHAWLPPRFAPNEVLHTPFGPGPLASLGDPAVLWQRFGANTGYNLLMLAVWFLGPLGVLLVGLGVLRDRFTKLLGLGVLTALAIGLFHDLGGIHAVGPIHYSECAVPLGIIAVHGLERLGASARRFGLELRTLAAAIACVMVLGLGTFNLHHARALEHRAEVQDQIYGTIERSAGPGSVVLAPKFDQVWSKLPEPRMPGSWVLAWRHPRPDFRDEVLILHDAPGVLEPLRARFPERRFFRLGLAAERPHLTLEPIP